MSAAIHPFHPDARDAGDDGPVGYVADIETELLGRIASGHTPHPVAAARVSADDFVLDAHGALYAAMGEAWERYGAASPPIMRQWNWPDEWLRGFKSAFRKSPAKYLLDCATGMTGLRQTDACRNVLMQSARFRLQALSGRVKVAAEEPLADATRIVREAACDLDEIAGSLRTGVPARASVSIAQAVEGAAMIAHEARERGDGVTGCAWGWGALDRMTGGLQRQQLTLLAARPSIGKSTVALAALLNAAEAGHGGCYLSLEMPAEQLGLRAASDLIDRRHRGDRVPYSLAGRGAVEPWQIDRMIEAADAIADMPLWIEDTPGLTLSTARVRIEACMERAERAGHPLQIVCIDHIGLMGATDRYRGNRVNEIAEITAGLKAMAREYGVAVLALSQLSRALDARDNKRPMLSDLRDSGAIEQDADAAIFLYREAYYLEREKTDDPDADDERIARLAAARHDMEVIVAKQRMGPTGTALLWCDMAIGAVRDVRGGP